MRILAVDDDQSARRIVSNLLAAHGYTVDTVSDGSGALDLVSKGQYDLAVLDYDMPEMNGIELLRQIAKLRPETVAIFLTASTALDDAAGEPNLRYVLAKPIDVVALLGVVEQLIGAP